MVEPVSAAIAVFIGIAGTALWLIPLGIVLLLALFVLGAWISDAN